MKKFGVIQKVITAVAVGCLIWVTPVAAQIQQVSAQKPLAIETGLNVSFPEVGKLQTRTAKEISASSWSIGGETLDRDYTDYHSYKKYLGPLGAKRIRLQGGWAKCEKVKGQYDFAWLDAIVQDAVAQGVSPWIELSYGNPIYEGGGEAKLAGALPTAPQAFEAWDNWVRAMVTRYKNQVKDWEIWNEPDLAKDKITGESYADFYIRTAELIRSIQPDAKLMAFGLASPNRLEFVEPLFIMLKEQNKLNLVDILTYHGYSPNPDNSYPIIEKLRQMVWQYNPNVVFMQGENGAPSTPKEVTIGAMRDHDWTELTQAKWDLRRMLGDHGRGIATNLFTISDMHYAAGDHMVGVNTKGLLKTNPDKTIERPKMAYKAAQHVFSLFDSQIQLSSTQEVQVKGENISAFQYAHQPTKGTLVTVWNKEAKPADTYEPTLTDITVKGSFKQPVFVDLITGVVYQIPAKQWKKSGTTHTFTQIPVPDYPVLIAESSALRMSK
ncbi:hypothetical protein Q0590_25595 [Rhodocytophaga aerolata]|uniref:Glycosyl hydrolases family 39 N-terminal catalytic domain-containing protein n=1 Tax=Rhodocytophaga aerolata TaxID=455078 RepID=A0ABT8RC44_9BACT|nr:hypothetical protein [Rhodocytophaga aerolata]MDO1449677.1 hypothetical protein [Rhodocytophaga aerolata]